MAAPKILAPDVRRDPSVWTGLVNTPEFRGMDAETINVRLPRYASFEEAAAQMPGSDADKTMRLQAFYGLGQNYTVKGGRIVKDPSPLLKGILGGTALIGGLSALGALTGGGAAAGSAGALSSSTIPAATGLTTGAVAAPSLTAATAATGVGAASTAGGAMGLGGTLKKVGGWLAGRGGETLANIGRTASGAAAASAENRLKQAQILANLYQTQATIANQQAQADREAQSLALRRAMVANQMSAPPSLSVAAPAFLANRMATVTRPTVPPGSRDALMQQLGAPVPAYRAPTMPSVGGSSAEETILGLLGLTGSFAGAGRTQTAPNRLMSEVPPSAALPPLGRF